MSKLSLKKILLEMSPNKRDSASETPYHGRMSNVGPEDFELLARAEKILTNAFVFDEDDALEYLSQFKSLIADFARLYKRNSGRPPVRDFMKSLVKFQDLGAFEESGSFSLTGPGGVNYRWFKLLKRKSQQKKNGNLKS